MSRSTNLRHLKRLYEFKLRELIRPIKFALVGLSGVIVDLVALTAFLSVFQLAPARALAIWLAMTWNYVWNRALTFKEAQEGSWVRQYARFVLSCSAGAVVSWGSTMAIVSSSWLGDSPLLASSVGILVGAGFNYCLCLFWVFRVRQKASSSAVECPRSSCAERDESAALRRSAVAEPLPLAGE